MNENFSKISPFVIEREISRLVGSVKNVRKINDGLLIETLSDAQSDTLRNVTRFCEFDVTVEPHHSLNFSKGVVTSLDLANCTLDEIKNGFLDQGVVDVVRLTTFRNGARQDTASYLLTFNVRDLPPQVKAGYLSLPVRPYIPPPMRCFVCQRFGHTAQRCNKPKICICGQPPHQGVPCSSDVRCVNCGSDHKVTYRNCPVFKEELAIQRLRTINRIPYSEAKRIVRSDNAPSNRSYSDVAKSLNVNQSVKELADLIIPEILRALSTYTTSATSLNASDPLAKRAAAHDPFVLQNSTPTSVLRRKVHTPLTEHSKHLSESKSTPTSRLKKFSSKNSLDEVRLVEAHCDNIIAQIERAAGAVSPSRSVDEGHSSVRARSSSDSTAGTGPEKKRITLSTEKADSDTDSEMFDAEPPPTTRTTRRAALRKSKKPPDITT